MIREPRDFPAIEELLQSEQLTADVNALPRPIAAKIIKETVASLKQRLIADKKEIKTETLNAVILSALRAARSAEVRHVINATGILVHTNLGRAPLSGEMFDSLRETLTGYCNVEFDMKTGARGDRGVACESYLTELSEAEAGTVVNNCAAALFLILNTLAPKKKVLISRGELVQIGGGFRIPDILKRAGAKLTEVGTTNITSLADYEAAIDDQTALILKVHKSNFVQAGFTEEVSLKELAALGNSRGIPVVNDLGSGVFIDTQEFLGYSEPSVQQSVRAGTDLTCFSGDKLLGGMQAGLIAGKAELVKKLKKNPLFRTVRADKVVFTILEKLLAVYLNGSYRQEITLWRLLSAQDAELYLRGKGLVKDAGNPPGVSVEASKAYVGGGSLPEMEVSSVAICFSSSYKAEKLISSFRRMDPPIIGRIESERFMLDLKAIPPSEYMHLLAAIRSVIAG